MAYDCDSAKVDLLANYGNAYDAAFAGYLYLLAGYNEYNYGTDHAAIGEILDACTEFFAAIWKLCGKDTNYDPPYLSCYLWENCAGAVTAKAICEAWAKDDFEYRAMTIAYIDRQRQLIWNEPFFVAWAARPESEGE